MGDSRSDSWIERIAVSFLENVAAGAGWPWLTGSGRTGIIITHLNNLIHLHLELNLKENQTAPTHMNASLFQPDAGLYRNALVGFTTAPGKLELSSIRWLCFYTHI